MLVFVALNQFVFGHPISFLQSGEKKEHIRKKASFCAAGMAS